jgi:hypothetical protein
MYHVPCVRGRGIMCGVLYGAVGRYVFDRERELQCPDGLRQRAGDPDLVRTHARLADGVSTGADPDVVQDLGFELQTNKSPSKARTAASR